MSKLLNIGVIGRCILLEMFVLVEVLNWVGIIERPLIVSLSSRSQGAKVLRCSEGSLFVFVHNWVYINWSSFHLILWLENLFEGTDGINCGINWCLFLSVLILRRLLSCCWFSAIVISWRCEALSLRWSLHTAKIIML